MQDKRLNILAPTRYPWAFNGPKDSAHAIHNRKFLPLNKIDDRLDGCTVFPPFPLQKIDLVHAFNRIPIGATPYVIGFESHLPRVFGLQGSAYHRMLERSLASDRCRAIIAFSDCARRLFLSRLTDHVDRAAIEAKLQVRFPNIVIPERQDRVRYTPGDTIRLFFVGGQFARKGGLTALRLAQLASERGLPVQLDIISSLEMGKGIWIDPPRQDFYAPYLELLKLDNVTLHGAMGNTEVLDMAARAHFSILPTLTDTFGFSVIESMTRSTPVIASAQVALPEFIVDGQNGVLLPMETNTFGGWIHTTHPDKASPEYEALYAAEVERLAHSALDALERTMADPDAYHRMRTAAYDSAVAHFDHRPAREFWDGLYRRSVQ